ncbi:hypothetical protein THII_3254 [Thioploca ingrica]|uniref:DUF3782 domain-containing protein n=1 Tax=Thioploca ingrica TaxID=40754 RepID=A0A090BVW2_9GAMM|nr:hypothetical protein THII_3254 [Thioploca ingrica]
MTQITLDPEQLDQLILQRLPTLIQQNSQIQRLVLDLARQDFADRKETDDRFYQLLGELRRDREEQNCKWDEQNCKWEDAKREFDRMHEAIMAIAKKYDRSITAIGARWGIKSESSFRNALVGILEKSFGVQVLNINDYDDEGVVFGRPDQIELDVIIKNGLLIICEIKSSIDKAGMYSFERKVRFYEKKHQRQVTRMLVISPMVDAKAEQVAQKLGIEVYSDSVEVKDL